MSKGRASRLSRELEIEATAGSILSELSEVGGRTITEMIPDLAAILMAFKRRTVVEGLLILILSSQKVRQYEWKFPPSYKKGSGILPISGESFITDLVQAAGVNNTRAARTRVKHALESAARDAGGPVETKVVVPGIVDAIADPAPGYFDVANVRQGRRKRAKLGISRQPGRPKTKGHE